MNKLFEKRQKLSRIALALKHFPELNKMTNAELILEAVEEYIKQIDAVLTSDEGVETVSSKVFADELFQMTDEDLKERFFEDNPK